MSTKMSMFLCDMGVSVAVTQWLRENGYDAKHLRDEHLERLSDELIFEKASKENRVTLTFDLDFGEILSRIKAKQPSVIIFRLEDQTPSNVIHHMKNITSNYMEHLTEGVVLLVTERKYRIRHLPIE